ncbi:MAG TPA: ABC transporter substrate-binding protein [Ramlibacter sp.]|uniref:ABC transporter substrate-binding protein n=1 Tax=Ramlibacter sp. TaxID=1917967 RepID=UPI002B553452|nr:ABC transporter substrate-binding protein [Ramlibacter sp.]HVZ43851.1 ABC transporter substrate-binding protein [Ramlibacter sp.]
MRRRAFNGTGAAALLAGSLPAAFAQQPQRGGTLVVATTFEPRQLNLATTTSWADHLVGAKILSSLLRFPEKGFPTPQGDLAEKWDVSPDGRRITFNLRRARWHDGKPFTSEDVKFTFEQVLPKLNPNRSIFEMITKVDTPDAQTVVMERTQPFVMFYFDIFNAAILPKHVYEGTDVAKNPANLRPVGTGPFKLKEWMKGSHIELARFDDYFKPGQPYLDRVLFKFVPDVNTAVAALETGEVDLVPRWVPVSDVARLKAKPGIELSSVGGIALSQNRLMTFNLKDPALKDVRVRQAVARAIDAEAVTRIATGGQYAVGESFLWKQFPEFDAKFSVPARFKHDVAASRQLLDAAGLKPGAGGTRLKLELLTHNGVPDLDKTVEVIRNQLADVGIEVSVKRVERALAFEMAKDGKFQLYIHSSWTGGPDPVAGVQRLFVSENVGKLMGNVGTYVNKDIDDLTHRALGEANPLKKKELVGQLQEIFLRDLPALPLQQWVPLSAYRAGLRNVTTHSADGHENFEDTYRASG